MIPRLQPILLFLSIPLWMATLGSECLGFPTGMKMEGLANSPQKKSRGLPQTSGRKSTRGNFGMDPAIMPVSYRYYDVKGRDRKTIRRQMDRHGPKKKTGGGGKAVGLTEWRVSWEMQYSYNADNICTEFNVQVKGSIVFTMPRWTGYGRGSADLKKRWDTMYEALQRHEDGHALHGVRALREIRRLNPRLNRHTTCQNVTDDFSRRAQAIMQKYNQKDIDYDRETRHGITQGAVF